MKLSVIIPCYNEKATILEILRKVQEVSIDKEIIIVDDGSTDGTRELLSGLSDDNVKVILHEKNKGKGAAIRTGIGHASGDIIIIQDADLEYDPNDYPALVKPIENGDALVVYGSRLLRQNNISYLRYFLGGKLITLITNLLYGTKITDEPTCYKVFRADLLKSLDLKCTRFEFCPEVTAKIAKKHIKIHEVPISYYPRSLEEGKKIGWKDGIEAILTLLKYRFRN
ncbi:MAG: glycosyltransferase family 2 protein [Actinomycetota bacterium]|nr:glycosyltransferase family 2 protein [Actinomycetota bacterium]